MCEASGAAVTLILTVDVPSVETLRPVRPNSSGYPALRAAYRQPQVCCGARVDARWAHVYGGDLSSASAGLQRPVSAD